VRSLQPDTQPKSIRLWPAGGGDEGRNLSHAWAVSGHRSTTGKPILEKHDSFIADYIAGLDQEACLSNWTADVTMFANVRAAETVQFVSRVSADGAIVLGTESGVDEVGAFGKAPIPVVILDTYYGHLPLDFVDMSNEAAAFTAISHFIEHGHREIGFVKGDAGVANSRLRERANTVSFRLEGYTWSGTLQPRRKSKCLDVLSPSKAEEKVSLHLNQDRSNENVHVRRLVVDRLFLYLECNAGPDFAASSSDRRRA
jgi:hypothetical protein